VEDFRGKGLEACTVCTRESHLFSSMPKGKRGMIAAANRASQPARQMVATGVEIEGPPEVKGQQIETELRIMRADVVVAAVGTNATSGFPKIIERSHLAPREHQ
jgi:hypothetical protein